MSQHCTRNTIAFPKHCRKCGKERPHRVGANHKVGNCLVCLYNLDPRILSSDELQVLGITEQQRKLDIWAKQKARDEAPKQEVLFA